MANYDFSSLSPIDFELLVRDLISEKYGWHLEAFGQGRDGGIDLRAREEGRLVIVQCKHYAGSTFSDLLRAAKNEKKKVDSWAPVLSIRYIARSRSRSEG
jgi:Holliday junction resolvase-like predicted endonuclease